MSRYLVTFTPGNIVPTRTKYIDDAVGPPDADVDAGTDGVAFGSVLYDGTDLWFCVDPTTAAAVWVQINGGGSDDLSTLLIDTSVTGANDVDRNDAATHDLTLTGNSTLTPIHSDPLTGDAIDLRVIVRQDGTGSRTLAWGGTIEWAGGSAPTMPTAANALLTVGLLSVDDGVTWLGYGGDTDDQTAAQVPFTPTGTIAATDVQAAIAEVASEAATALTAAIAAHEAAGPGDHFHIVGEPLTYDGSSTVYFLANLADDDTPAAYNKDGARVAVTHDTTTPDKITFGVAPAAGTGYVDYVAA
jgi:hypothetical protein